MPRRRLNRYTSYILHAGGCPLWNVYAAAYVGLRNQMS